MLFGVDVSDSQGSNVDFEEMARSQRDDRPPFRFAIVKATEGGDYRSKSFEGDWKKLCALDPRSVGPSDPWMVRGAYHFARQDNRTEMTGREAGETEARWFCQVLKEVGYGEGCLPPFLDWETHSGAASRNREWIEGFIDVVVGELGCRPGIYTGPNVWSSTTGNWDALVGEIPLWEVKYASNGWDPAVKYPSNHLLKGGAAWRWDLWQWSAGGDWQYYQQKYGPVPGVPGGVADVSRFDGTEQELRALTLPGGSNPATVAPIAITPTEIPLGSGIMQYVDLASFGTSQRSQLVAAVQGLLLAASFGPSGLVGKDGLPDGKAGPKTLDALRGFKSSHGLSPDTTVDPLTWWLLLMP